jgi:hypothetical protein
MRKAALVTYALALLVFVAFAAIPFITRKRDQPAAVPNPPALSKVALDEIGAGATLCISDIAAEPHSQVARFQVGTFGKPGPPLDLVVTGAGYRTAARERAGYADNATHELAIAPPPRAQLVSACIRNGGRNRIVLYSAGDSARSRAHVTVRGASLRPTPALAFYEARRRSIAERVPLTVDRIATFRGPLSHTWIVWLVLAAFVIVLPLGVGFALWRDWRET